MKSNSQQHSLHYNRKMCLSNTDTFMAGPYHTCKILIEFFASLCENHLFWYRLQKDVKSKNYLFIVCFICSINKQHAILTVSDKGEAELKPGAPGAKTKLNGMPLTGPTMLMHKDRILFGELSTYI